MKPTGSNAGLAKSPKPGNVKEEVSIDVGEFHGHPEIML